MSSDEKRRKKATQALLESPPIRSVSMQLNPKPSEPTESTAEEADSSSAQSKEEEIVKLKPSQLPLMNQVRSQLSSFFRLLSRFLDGIHTFMQIHV